MMATQSQRSLFSSPVPPVVPVSAGRDMPLPPDSSPPQLPPPVDCRRLANRAIGATAAANMLDEVRAFFHRRGITGLTDEELQLYLNLRPDTARARRCELRDLGELVDSGRRRPTSSGRKATVWIVAALADRPAPRQVPEETTSQATAKPQAIDTAAAELAALTHGPSPASGRGETEQTVEHFPEMAHDDHETVSRAFSSEIPTEQTLPLLPPRTVAHGQGEPCRKCKSVYWVEVAISFGRVRRDCRQCGAFLSFPVWHPVSSEGR